MKRWWFIMLGCLWSGLALAEEAVKPFTWNPPQVGRGMFTQELGMLDSERNDYATNLTTYAVNRVVTLKASPASLDEARRLIALALHLSPRNRKALVASYQLSKGVMPEVSESDYSPPVMARLLLTRGQLLEKQEGEENRKLARMFIELAASMDPKNEDVVYASEVQRLDHGGVNWGEVVDYKPRAATTPEVKQPEVKQP